VIRRLKDAIKRHWPPLRLRVILTLVLLFVAVLPALGAVFLRVFENTLVRQTEAELIAQAAVIEAAYLATAGKLPPAGDSPAYRPEPLTIDLNAMDILPERPPGRPAGAPDPETARVAAAIAPLVARASETTLASIRIVDAAGVVVLGRADLGLGYGALPEVQAALAGRSLTVLRRRGDYVPRYAFEVLSRAAAIRVHYARPITAGGKVVGAILLSRSPRALFRGIYDDLGKIAAGSAIGLFVVIGLAGVLSRTITRPIEELGRAATAIAAGRGEVPETPQTAAVEIRALFRDFRLMAEKIERRSAYLRDFAAALSHEFKTPLAGIRGALELLEDHGGTMTESERRRFLANAAGDVARLTRLVGRLLDLARADMARFGDPARCALADSLHRVADALRGADFAIEGEVGEAILAMPAEVLEAVFAILFENSRQAGAHRVTVTAAPVGGRLRVEVADDGPGIPPGDRERLFEPFFTTRRAEGGSGLGLAIARALLANAGAGIDLVPGEGGARFRLELPLS